MTKKTKRERELKVMTEIKNDEPPKLREAKGHVHETKTPEIQESKPDPDLEKAYQALKDLGGTATSPKLAEKLGFEGETRRDKVRRLMDRLIKEKRVHKTKQHSTTEVARKREYVYQLVVEAAA